MASLEIACFNAESALVAASHGAQRIELCASRSLGGTTPSLTTFHTVKSGLLALAQTNPHPASSSNATAPHRRVPIFVMIRPRGGDFTYSGPEFAAMARDVRRFRAAGADGFVFGVLTGEGAVDVARCRALVAAAAGGDGGGEGPAATCTFHRAFDRVCCGAPGRGEEALRVLAAAGFGAVLTSGGARTAVEGRARLRCLLLAARGLGLEIIVGGAVRAENLALLRRETGAAWFHSSAVLGEGDAVDGAEVDRLREASLLADAGE